LDGFTAGLTGIQARTSRLDLAVYDDASDPDRARDIARQIAASDALAVIGPATTAMALAAGPVYAEAGLASIGTIATSDRTSDNATTFRAVFSTSDGGESLANYLRYALGNRHATVIFKNDGYGQPFTEGFKRAAERLGISTTYRPFVTDAERQQVAVEAAAEPANGAIVLGMVVADAVPVLAALRRQGAPAPILGTNAIAGEFLPAFFKDEPEERRTPGFFTDGVYAASSHIFDSANAETLAFGDRFRARFGREPSYISVHGYEVARLAIAAARAASAQVSASADQHARREATRSYLVSLDSPDHGLAGLAGPIWFTPERGRLEPLRLGRFHGALFESAPLQVVPVTNPDPAEIAAGSAFAVGPGRYARLQRVVYTGLYIDEIPHVDLARSSFNADFHLWLRFAKEAGPDSADPTDLSFPTLISGSFDRTRPAEQRDMADGTVYRLWRVQGEFRNDFDLHRYPFDRQTLALSFFNARASMERLVYVVDQRRPPPPGARRARPAAPASPWRPRRPLGRPPTRSRSPPPPPSAT
jgi:ABC-type branched-subunit amino acid transport system substrate-binding protein